MAMLHRATRLPMTKAPRRSSRHLSRTNKTATRVSSGCFFLSQQETRFNRVASFDPEIILAYQVRGALYFRNHGVPTCECSLLDHGSGKAGIDNALDPDFLPHGYFVACEVNCHTARHPRTSWATIDLAVGEHANVATVVVWVMGCFYENRTVKKAHFRFERMRNLPVGFDHRSFNA